MPSAEQIARAVHLRGQVASLTKAERDWCHQIVHSGDTVNSHSEKPNMFRDPTYRHDDVAEEILNYIADRHGLRPKKQVAVMGGGQLMRR
jgi:hypothetical protein